MSQKLTCFLDELEKDVTFHHYYDFTREPHPDPFHNLTDNISETKLCKLDCVVFAEPLNIVPEKLPKTYLANNEKKTENVTINIGNVSVTKRNGKRKSYQMKIDESQLMCPQQNCKKTFTSVTLLKAHIRKVHCSDKEFVCEQCGASFKARYLLKRHYAVHGGEKVQCPICDKRLSKRTNMALHLRSHSDTRPHQCPTCRKRFLRTSTLKVHINCVHKGGAER